MEGEITAGSGTRERRMGKEKKRKRGKQKKGGREGKKMDVS
jgi:hypothetical protein